MDSLAYMAKQGNMIGIRELTFHEDKIIYLIFKNKRLVFWSDNQLASGGFPFFGYDIWEERGFLNAKALCRWHEAGDYDILALIPVKWYIQEKKAIEQSFSYRPMLAKETKWWQTSRTRVRIFYYLSIIIMVAVAFGGIVHLIRSRGFHKMKIRGKIRYLMVAIVFALFIYLFAVSTIYTRRHYEDGQRVALQQKAQFIQSALQNLYYWDIGLSPANSHGLNVDLRDLAFSYGTDIHVYDIYGRLVGSSTPQLFDNGILSRYIAPEPYFTEENTMTLTEHLGDISYLAAYTEFYNGNFVPIGYIAVPSFISQDEVAEELDGFLSRILPPCLIGMIIAILLSLRLSKRVTDPLHVIGDKMRSFQLGGKNKHIVYADDDELGQLVERYNELVDELAEAADRLSKSEREGAWRTMARQVAHEINNPLTPMKLTVQQVKRLKGTDRFDEAFDKATDMLIEQIDSLSRIASGFSTFVKMPEVRAGWVDVALKLNKAYLLATNNDRGIPITYLGPEYGVFARADEDQIGQVFTNLLRNALQALEHTADPSIIVSLRDADDEDYVEVSIMDNGPGIPEDVQQKIFIPNFTTKSSGSGLGLAISKNIVEGAEGKISFKTSEKGTIFLVYLKKKL
ncbi:MAG: HAMP domain-containing histidine kinase [Paludibacteraceae bacterium]|nr:HAMP domain-containing histidine kinase [Paludibacteraceae bacterium]